MTIRVSGFFSNDKGPRYLCYISGGKREGDVEIPLRMLCFGYQSCFKLVPGHGPIILCNSMKYNALIGKNGSKFVEIQQYSGGGGRRALLLLFLLLIHAKKVVG